MPALLEPQSELDIAESALTDLRDRLGRGDRSVTAKDLADAEAAVHLAQVRIDAANEVAAKDRERQRENRIQELRASLPAVFDPTEVDAATTQMQEAIDAYCTAVANMERRVSDAWNELSSLGSTTGLGSGRIEDFQIPNVQRGIRDAAYVSLRKHWPRTQIRLDQ